MSQTPPPDAGPPGGPPPGWAGPPPGPPVGGRPLPPTPPTDPGYGQGYGQGYGPGAGPGGGPAHRATSGPSAGSPLQTPTARSDVPLHPLLPGGTPPRVGSGPAGGHHAHLEPHAASAGRQDGSVGAMWFAVGTALVVLLCLVAAALLALAA
jgi:hypothetical protein